MTKAITNAVAIVPAAGNGERLGRVAKALLRTESGETFLERIVARANAVGIHRVVVATGGRFAAPVAAAAKAVGAQVVFNPEAQAGMGSTIAAAFTALLDDEIAVDPTACALMWPVDHPHVLVPTLHTLLHVWELGIHDVVIPTYFDRGGHPVFVARRRWPAMVGAAVAPRGARSILSSMRCERVAVLDAGVVRDIDTPSDMN